MRDAHLPEVRSLIIVLQSYSQQCPRQSHYRSSPFSHDPFETLRLELLHQMPSSIRALALILPLHAILLATKQTEDLRFQIQAEERGITYLDHDSLLPLQIDEPRELARPIRASFATSKFRPNGIGNLSSMCLGGIFARWWGRKMAACEDHFNCFPSFHLAK